MLFTVVLALLALNVISGYIEDGYGTYGDSGDSDPYDNYEDLMDSLMRGPDGPMHNGHATGAYDDGTYDDLVGGLPRGTQSGSSGSPLQLLSIEDMSNFLEGDDSDKAAVIGYFDVNTNAACKLYYDQVSDKHGETYRFGIVTNKSLLEDTKYEGAAVIVYKARKFMIDSLSWKEKSKSRYTSKYINPESLEHFIFDKSLPLIGEYSLSNEGQYLNSKLPILFVFGDYDHKNNQALSKFVYSILKKVAEEGYSQYLGKILFAISSKIDFVHDIQEYGFKDIVRNKNDIGVGILHNNVFYKMDESIVISSDIIQEYVASFFNGKLEKEMKGKFVTTKKGSRHAKGRMEQHDEVIEGGARKVEFDESHVIKLTSSNFDDIVNNPNKDVLIDFYAPWCGHCKFLKPEYEALAKYFKDDARIAVAAMDASEHNPPKEFDVQGYPTITLVKANNKQNKISYNGPRNEKDIIEWVIKNR